MCKENGKTKGIIKEIVGALLIVGSVFLTWFLIVGIGLTGDVEREPMAYFAYLFPIGMFALALQVTNSRS